jgi:heptosyltransferase-1
MVQAAMAQAPALLDSRRRAAPERPGPPIVLAQSSAMRILIVRLSAMGDVIHALPALTDLRKAMPQAHITMAVDERFADIVRLHTGVDQVMAIGLKRWKGQALALQTWREIKAALRELRQQRYDLALDLHGLNKSAALIWLARAGLKIGPHPSLCGEWLAPKAYHRHSLPDQAHLPVPRMRGLLAQALQQTIDGPADFGLRHRWQGAGSHEVVLLHGTSALHKLWPESDWIDTGRFLIAQGLQPVLAWGSTAEHERAIRLAQAMGSQAVIAPACSILQWAEKLSRCRLVIGVDTGLTHLAAASAVPCIALFKGTPASLFTPQEPRLARSLDGRGQSPAAAQVHAAVQELLAMPTV